MVRIILPFFLLLLSVASHAAPVTIGFTAMIGDRNNIDTDDVFGEGVAADLSGQTIVGSFTIDPSALTQVCSFSGACYLDYGAGAIAAAFTLNGITASVISTGTLGFAGQRRIKLSVGWRGQRGWRDSGDDRCVVRRHNRLLGLWRW